MKELLLIFKFLVSPQPSWREMVDAGKPAVEHERKWFYPLMALAAATAFLSMLYGAELTAALTKGIVIFASFFLSYQLCPALMAWSIRKFCGVRCVESEMGDKFKYFAMLNMSMLIVVTVIQNILPVPLQPLYIFPLCLFYPISRCAGEFGIDDERKSFFSLAMFACTILVPVSLLLILWHFVPES